MRAVVCRRFGAPEGLIIDDVAEPAPDPGEALIEVRACGVTFTDVLRIRGTYQDLPELPFVPGTEVSGVVVGEGSEGLLRRCGIRMGDRVAGIVGTGGLAERAVIHASSLLPVPPHATDAEAATFHYSYGTSFYALARRAGLRPSETLLVLGAAGGVGAAAVEIGTALGATVIGVASTPKKLALCKDIGAHHLINYADSALKEAVLNATDGRGADVVCDLVGAGHSVEALRSLAWRGRYLVVGFAGGEVPMLPLNRVLLKEAEVLGVLWGDYVRRCPSEHLGDTAELLALWASKRLLPRVSEVLRFSRAGEAIAMLAERRAIGRIAVTLR